jgi:hypothetical protein
MTIFVTKPEYFSPIVKEDEWRLPFLFERIYKIDHDIALRYWQAYYFSESLHRSLKPVIIVTLSFDGDYKRLYHWYRPDLDAIVTERNYPLLKHLFDRDIQSCFGAWIRV